MANLEASNYQDPKVTAVLGVGVVATRKGFYDNNPVTVVVTAKEIFGIRVYETRFLSCLRRLDLDI